MEKHIFLAESVFTPLWDLKNETPGVNCYEWDVFFRKVRCMGDFLRNQIITDMKYTWCCERANDWDRFCLAGPGTQRGLNRLLGRDLDSKWDQSAANMSLQDLRSRIRETHPEWTGIFQDLNNLANCLCEYDKYMRVKLNEGTPRSKYEPKQPTLFDRM